MGDRGLKRILIAALVLAGAACGGLEEEGEGLGPELLVAQDAPEEELVTVVADEPVLDSDLPSLEGEAIADDAEAPSPEVAEVDACTCESGEDVPELGEDVLLIEEPLLSDEPAPEDAEGPTDDAEAGAAPAPDEEPPPSDEPPAAEAPSSTEAEEEAPELLPS